MRYTHLLALMVLAVLLVACTPSAQTASPSQVSFTATQPVMQSTNTAPPPTLAPTATQEALPTATTPPIAAPVEPTPTSTAEPTQAPRCRDQAEMVRHLSVSPGSNLLEGAFFAKLWRIKNTGECTWTSEYTIQFLNGETFKGADRVPLTGTVKPGETIDVTLNLMAPLVAGDYSGSWQLVDPQGEPVSMAGGESAPLLVQIVVKHVPEYNPRKRGEECP